MRKFTSLLVMLLAFAYPISVFRCEANKPPASNCNPKKYKVGDQYGWEAGIDYKEWTKNKQFHVGDTLEFGYAIGVPLNHSLVRVNKHEFVHCLASPNLGEYNTGHDRIVLSDEGTYYFISGVPGDCEQGMKLEIKVKRCHGPISASAPAPSPDGPRIPSPVCKPKRYRVGDQYGWEVGVDYKTWVKNKRFHIGDTLEFAYSIGEGINHNLVRVNKKEYKHCLANPNLGEYHTGHDDIVLRDEGNYYFMSGIQGDCACGGMKLKIKVTGCHSSAHAPKPSQRGFAAASPQSADISVKASPSP